MTNLALVLVLGIHTHICVCVCVCMYDGGSIFVGIAGLSSMSDNRSNYAVISEIKLEVVISDQISEAS